MNVLNYQTWILDEWDVHTQGHKISTWKLWNKEIKEEPGVILLLLLIWLVCLSAAALDSPVYRYVVTHTPSGPVNTSLSQLPFPSRFSFHCMDAMSFFGGLESVMGKPLSDGDKNFQDLITHHLVTFAKTGELPAACLNVAALNLEPELELWLVVDVWVPLNYESSGDDRRVTKRGQ